MKKMLVYVLFIIGSILCVPNVYAQNVYYIATWGDDTNDGTFENPWGTWQKGFSTARAGDTVYFRGGTWYRQQDEPNPRINVKDGIGNSGTKSSPIHYFAYPPDIANGDTVIYDGINHLPGGEIPDAGYNEGIYIDNADYLHFKGLTIRNFWQGRAFVRCAGMTIFQSNNIILENLTIYNIGGRGVWYYPRGASNNHSYFINIDTYNCYNTYPDNQYRYDNNQTGSDGKGMFLVVFDEYEIDQYIEIRGCRAWNCSDDGWNICSGAIAVTENSWTFLNGTGTSELNAGGGNGFKMNLVGEVAYEDPEQINHKVFNVISAFNKGYGFTQNDNGFFSINRQHYNNIAYKNSTVGFAVLGNHPPHEEWPVRNSEYINNIAYSNDVINFGEYQGGYAYSNLTNSWNNPPGHTVKDADFVNIADEDVIAQLMAPRKPDGSLPDITVFRLAEDSKLKGAGTNVGMSENPDIGIDWAWLDAGGGVPLSQASKSVLSRSSPAFTFSTARGAIVIEPGASLRGRIEVALYDGRGRRVSTLHNTGGKSLRIETKPFAPGVYTMRIRIDGKNHTRRVVVGGQGRAGR